jgi:multiple sugar transport system permease protein
LQNYIDVFAKLNLMRFILNSLIICAASTLISIVAGVPAAYGFARLKTRNMERLSLWILSNRMLPSIAVVIPLYLLLGRIGLLDTRIGLIIIYSAFNLPYVVWTLISFFEDIPIELDEAAALDGSSLFGVLYRIMVPIAAPGIIATAIFAFILCWSEFLFAVIFTSSTAQTLPVAIASFVTDRGIEWGRMSAAGSVLIVPLTVLFYSIQRFLIRGLSFGAVSG